MKNLLAILILTFSYTAFGQVYYAMSYYPNSGNPGGHTDLTVSGTYIAFDQSSNTWTSSYPIPIPFLFYGDTVKTFRTSHNGVITFDNPGPAPGDNTSLPTALLPSRSICGFWDKHHYDSYYNYGSIETKVLGTYPNRQFWIINWSWSLGSAIFNNFATVLEETSNKVYVVDISGHGGLHGIIDATVGVQLNASTATLAGTNLDVISGNSTSDNHYYEFEPKPVPDEDAGIVGIVSPTIPITPGIDTVKATLKNFGLNQLDSVQINWTVNGVLQQPVQWLAGSLATSDETTVTLGGYSFTGGLYAVKVWTALPNGLVDGNTSNDSYEQTLCTPLQGTYTVGGSGADFPNLTAAVSILDCGVSGPVTFNINQGSYNERITIGPITGASATNTITFNGNNNATIYSNPDYQSVIKLVGAEYITFEHLNIENNGYYAATGILLLNGSDHNTFKSCQIRMSGPWGTSYPNSLDCILGSANYLTVENCVLIGEVGIELTGNGVGNRILNNTFSYVYHNSIVLEGQDSLEIIGNYIELNNIWGAIRVNDVKNFKINENQIMVEESYNYFFFSSVIEVTGGNNSTPQSSNSQIINNMIYTEMGVGIYLSVSDVDVHHNTIRSKADECLKILGTNSNVNILNNVFYNDNNRIINISQPFQGNSSFDYNLFYTPSSTPFQLSGVIYSSLSAMQVNIPQDNQNSVFLNPQFLGPKSLRFNLPAANNLALPLAQVVNDIDGDQRPSPNEIKVDMGADEFSVSIVDIALTSMVAPGDTSYVCIGDSLPIEVMLFNYGTTSTYSIASINVTGAVTGSFTQNVTDTLYSNQPVSLFLGNLPITDFGNITISISVVTPGDINSGNNTLSKLVVLQSALNAYTTVMDETVLGANDGTILIDSILGGVSPYTVNWDNGQTGINISGLAPGNYNATITDNTGCQKLVSYEILPGFLTGVLDSNPIEEISVQLYPNPTSRFVVLEIDNPQINDTMIELISSNGSVLRRMDSFDIQSGKIKMDLSSFSVGMYWVKVRTNGNEIVKKLMIIR